MTTAGEILHNQGATLERKEKSNIVTAVRTLTKGGMVHSYGHHDTEHCTLDHLHNKGFIESHHYDAGYELRTAYYEFTKTGRWIDVGGKGYDGDFETPQDEAEEKYRKALEQVSKTYRDLTRYVCIEGTKPLPADYGLIQEVIWGLDELYKHFQK